MTHRDDSDRELRESFARLREDERPGAGSFRVPVRAARSARPRLLVPLLLSSVALMSVVVLRALSERVDRSPPRPVPPVSSWEAPTDFLLETPGRDLLRAIPPIGQLRGWELGKPVAEPADTDLSHPKRRTS
jgi:hypothetical protein